MRAFITCCCLLAVVLLPLRGEETKGGPLPLPVVKLNRTEPVSYEKEIEPILAAKCVYCHSGSVKRNELDLSTYDALMKGGKKGKAVVAGNSSGSLLVQLVAKTARPAMPPRSEEPVTPEELALIKLWIDQGARPPSAGREPARTALIPPAIHPVRAVAVSPDKSLVAAGRGNQVHIYQVTSGAHSRTLIDPDSRSGEPSRTGAARLAAPTAAHLSIVEALAFSPDGKTLASGSYQSVTLWDPQTGAVKQKLTGFADQVLALAFSRDGKLLATGGGAPSVDGEIKVFETATGKLLNEIKNGHTDSVVGVCFHPDGSKLATCGCDRLIKIFELHSGKLLKTLEGHTHHVLDVSWSPDGKLLASAGADKVVKVWDLDKGEVLGTFPDPKGKRNKGIAVTYTKEVARVAFVSNTELAAASGDQVSIWKADSGECLRKITGAAGFLNAVAVSPDGSVLVAGGDDGSIWLGSSTSDRFSRTLQPPR